MDNELPPKRVTRARAAAKSEIPEVKIATASSSKATRSNGTAAAKSKIKDIKDVEENNEEAMDQPPVKPKSTRGRPKKAVKEVEVEVEAEQDELALAPPPTRSTRGRSATVEREADTIAPVVAPVKTRGRPKKVVEEVPAPAVEAPKVTRGRAKKVAPVDEEEVIDVAPEPVKKATRGRPAAAAKATAPKKTVKFEEPHDQDKENILPTAAGKAKGNEPVTETGLKAKPVRKAAPAAATRSTRGRAKAVEEKTPLSPKKATQVAKSDSNSEDELATMEKTPMKPLQRSPLKAPGSIFGTAKKLDFTTSIVANRVMMPDSQSLSNSLMGSPARRPPPSPFKDAMKTSPKRAPGLGDSIRKPPLKASIISSMGPPASKESPFKTSLLQSPARRPQSPTKVSMMGSPIRASSVMTSTPKAAPFSISRFGATPRTLTKNAYRPGQPLFGSALKASKSDVEQPQMSSPSKSFQPFSGRLSSVMPRGVDVDLQETAIPVAIPEATETDTIMVVPVEPAVASLVMDEPMIIDDTEAPVQEDLVQNIETTTPSHSPPRNSVGSFDLHREEDPFQDSDSEDELASTSLKYSPAPLNSFNISSRDFAAPSTPTTFIPIARTPKTITGDATGKSAKARREKIGFTPLAQQLSSWLAASPESDKSSTDERAEVSPTDTSFPQTTQPEISTELAVTPVKSTFFDDEMSVREEMASEQVDIVMAAVEDGPSDEVDEIEQISEAEEEEEEVGFTPTIMDEVDFALAAEAEEMSLLEEPIEEPAEVLFAEPAAVEPVNDIFDDLIISENEITTDAAPANNGDMDEMVDDIDASIPGPALSEASQDYGDENENIDPALFALDMKVAEAVLTPAPLLSISTPVRVSRESDFVVHTVSKVPLKPAALDTPSRPVFDFSRQRPASASRLAAQRQAPPLPVPATSVTSRTLTFNPNVTPAKSTGWSTAGTPTRTPRRDVNSQVLKGAVVFVDVHTTEGADASAVFVELLGQMGAKCVKSWGWNPNSTLTSPEGSDGSSDKDSKIGITHVVFKDGGKRTIEKVRECHGVVSCVGVGWVLDCERTQSWLDEVPYSIDTSLVPRGGHRRRKSMEPRSLQKLNGSLTPRPNRPAATPRSVSASHINVSPSKDFLATPRTVGSIKMDRRKSTIWERSPNSEDGNNEQIEDDRLLLSPVPATPAPEAISMYAEHVLDGDSGEPTPYFLRTEDLVTKTAPANRVAERESGILGERTEEGTNGNGGGVLMQRLLLARRKSLQFAPKVGSPLARGASYGA